MSMIWDMKLASVFNAREREQIEEAASAAGLTVGSFLIQVVMHGAEKR